MDLLTILVLGIEMSMDAFAVSICKGVSLSKLTASKCLIVGAWFGVFQGIMPLTGYLLGSRFEHYVDTFSAWIAFFLLVLIGANMIRESLSEEENTSNAEFGFKTMFFLAVATSIDDWHYLFLYSGCHHKDFKPHCQYSSRMSFDRVHDISHFRRRRKDWKCIWDTLSEKSRNYRRYHLNLPRY